MAQQGQEGQPQGAPPPQPQQQQQQGQYSQGQQQQYQQQEQPYQQQQQQQQQPKDDLAGKMFVGGVSRQTSDQGFHDAFSKFGKVVDSIVMRDKYTQESRGFGFVTFEDPASVDAVLRTKVSLATYFRFYFFVVLKKICFLT